jgi:hypothetical protein
MRFPDAARLDGLGCEVGWMVQMAKSGVNGRSRSSLPQMYGYNLDVSLIICTSNHARARASKLILPPSRCISPARIPRSSF